MDVLKFQAGLAFVFNKFFVVVLQITSKLRLFQALILCYQECKLISGIIDNVIDYLTIAILKISHV